MHTRHFIVLLACVNGCARGVQLLSTRDDHVAASAADPEVKPMCVNPYNESFAWRILPQDPADVKLNICVDGKQLPEFYLLGPPKASTTSMSLDLMNTGIGTLGFDYRDEERTRKNPHCFKELHFFDQHMKKQQLSVQKARREWIADMPTCPADRRVLADFTPNNLDWVPAPEKFNLRRTRAIVNLPRMLKDWYGSKASAITFAVLFRRPLDRLHSVWNHAGGSRRSGVSSFQAAMEKKMEDMNAPDTHKEMFWGNMYSLHLKEWLRHFSASQFLVIPFRQYVIGDKDSVCKAISKKLRYQMMCDSEGRPPAEGKHHDGPSLDDETTDEFQTRFERFMEPEIRRLVDVISSMHGQGAALPGYDGPDGDKAAVRAWLLNNW